MCAMLFQRGLANQWSPQWGQRLQRQLYCEGLYVNCVMITDFFNFPLFCPDFHPPYEPLVANYVFPFSNTSVTSLVLLCVCLRLSCATQRLTRAQNLWDELTQLEVNLGRINPRFCVTEWFFSHIFLNPAWYFKIQICKCSLHKGII